jgi:surfactin synthase thioesterase subunit
VTDIDSAQWIRRFGDADDADVRLVCLPHAGGSASFFFPFATALGPSIDVLAVQYPGRQDRLPDPLIDNIADLADAVTAALRPWLDRPLAIFGHSMGASLAFEVAVRLTEDGVVPRHLFASGRRAPSRPRDGEYLHRADDDMIIAELSTMAGTDSRVLDDRELLTMILPAVRNDYHAAETYRYTGVPPLTCPITVLTGDDDTRVTPEEAQAWQAHTTAAFDLLRFPGGHFYLVDHQARVLEIITDRLSRVPEEHL